jgi:hypothetical protein
MNHKIRCYLSGPYSKNGNGKSIDANIIAARDIAVELWDKGYAAFCPHKNTDHFERYCKNTTYQDYLYGDLAFIEGMDAVVMIPGWEHSTGALQEKEHAEKCNIPVYIYPDLPPKDQSPKSILMEAEELINGSRQKIYGHPFHDFSRTAKIWSAMLGIEIAPVQVAYMMIAVKLSRLCQSPAHRDSLVDIAGYAGTAEKVNEYKEDSK